MLGQAGLTPLRQAQRALALLGALLLGMLLAAQSAGAQTFPQLSGRVVDAANVIPDDEEARLTQKLDALEKQSQRQLVVATVPSLEDYDISDYANRLFRTWQLGDKTRNDGALLLIAPTEHKLRIEVGYGLEGVVTDGLSSLIISKQIVPKFKAGDMPGGIEAGTDALITQLTLPDDQARQVAAQANAPRRESGGVPLSTLVWLAFFFFFFILPMLRRRRGRSYGGGLGQIILWNALDGMTRGGGGGGGWSSGGGSDWGGGGFSGGGGSSGGGGASGSW